MFNLHAAALGIIPPQKVTWLKNTGRTQNALGQWVNSYADPIDLVCSFQPVQLSNYAEMGLDLNKNYWTLRASADLISVDRDIAGDIVHYLNGRYQMLSRVTWFEYNGWSAVICVEIEGEP